MSQLKTKFIENLAVSTAKLAADSVDSSKIRLNNNTWLRSRNGANSADINVARVDASNRIQFGDTGASSVSLGSEGDSQAGIYVQPDANGYVLISGAGDADGGEVDFQTQEIWLYPAPDSVASTSLKFFDPTAGNFVALKADDAQATDIILTLPSTLGNPGDVLTDVAGDGVLSFQPVTSSGATTALDNLASTAVNADIIPGTDSSISLGSPSNRLINVSAQYLIDGNSNIVLDIEERKLKDVAGTLAIDFNSTDQVILTRSLAIYNAAADPGSAVAGWVYFNTVSNKLKVYNGTTWETVTSV